MTHITLTVADAKNNGFILLARIRVNSVATARENIRRIEALVPEEGQPDLGTDNFGFLLDAEDGRGTVTVEAEAILPTQIAMALAPDQVQNWLTLRPTDINQTDRNGWPAPTLQELAI